MTRATALAGAARRVRALNERLPERYRPPIAEDWARLLASIEDVTDRRALALIEEWQADMETRLSGKLANAPLEDRKAA